MDTNFFEQVAQAADAVKALPGLRQRIDELEAALAQKQRDLDTAQSDITDLRRDNDQIANTLRSTEEERDNYFLKAEEAIEKLEKVHSFLGVAMPKDEPVEPVKEEPMPFQATEAPSPAPSVGQGDAQGVVGAGQSDGPFVTSPPTQDTPSHPAPSPSADTSAFAASPPDYSKMAYWEKPNEVSWDEWVKGGGQKPLWVG